MSDIIKKENTMHQTDLYIMSTDRAAKFLLADRSGCSHKNASLWYIASEGLDIYRKEKYLEAPKTHFKAHNIAWLQHKLL